MQAKIKSIHLENFKGVKSADYIFDGKNVSAIGQNGAGKTTLFTAYMWLMADKDSDLKSNPNIRPIDTEECTPMVEAVFEIDGKEVTVAKIQKCTVNKGKNGGTDTISLSNSYEVNSVEYGERDFKKKMAEYGFGFDLFLPLSHLDVFTSQKSADMRKVLLGMVSEQSDFDIALQTDDCIDATNLLKMYTFDEVKAMQNATLRKIREEYGKDGEILRAKIEGMEQSKTDIDVAELELQKNALNEQIAENKTRQEDISKEFEEQQKASDGIIELKFELSDLQRKANEELVRQKNELRAQIDEKKQAIKDAQINIKGSQRSISVYEQDIESGEKEKKRLLEQWNKVKAETFDENAAICPTCHRELPQRERERLLSTFEDSKKERIANIEKCGSEVRADVKNASLMIPKLQGYIKGNLDAKERLEKEVSYLEKQLSELPESIDISNHPEVQEIQRQIAEKEAATNKGNSAEEIRQRLKGELETLQKQMDAVNRDLTLAQKNVEIDEQIAALCKKQGEFEQNKANAEKILDQLDMVSKRKSELLTDQVNSHFKLVKFRLFDYLKNGNVVDDCEPIIDGKSLKDHSNGALRVLAKLDIVDGLQRFYGQHYPVFAEDFSLVTDNTECRIDMECQLIKLVAKKGVKELKIEVEG